MLSNQQMFDDGKHSAEASSTLTSDLTSTMESVQQDVAAYADAYKWSIGERFKQAHITMQIVFYAVLVVGYIT